MTICERCGARLDAPKAQPRAHLAIDLHSPDGAPLGRIAALLCSHCAGLLREWLKKS